MEELRHVMRVIDENSHKLSEGDYLMLCNLLRKIFIDKQSGEWCTLIDYEIFDIYTPGQRDEVMDHFHDYFYNISMVNEESYLRVQIDYLNGELKDNKPIKRVTKYVKHNAIRQYCELHNVRISKYDEEHLLAYMNEHQLDIGDPGTYFKNGVKNMYRSYIAIENTFREMYREAIQERIYKLNSWITSLDEM